LYSKSIKQLPQNQRTNIIKASHGWLPTNDHLHKIDKHHCKTCPTCNQEEETQCHLLTCQHPTRKTLRIELIKQIKRASKAQNGDPEITALITEHINAFLSQDDSVRTAARTAALAQAQKSQAEIGWRNLFYGHMSNDILQVQSNYLQLNSNPAKPYLTAISWGKQILNTLWSFLDETWYTRCQDQHGDHSNHSDKQLRRLEPKIQACYDMQNQILPNDARFLLSTPLEERLQMHPRAITIWLKMAEPLIKQSLQDAIANERRTHRDIRTFFQQRD
jgi:hypothetical protein